MSCTVSKTFEDWWHPLGALASVEFADYANGYEDAQNTERDR